MKRIGISADGSCDLSAEIAEQYGITIIPQAIIMEGKTYRDGTELRPADIGPNTLGIIFAVKS